MALDVGLLLHGFREQSAQRGVQAAAAALLARLDAAHGDAVLWSAAGDGLLRMGLPDVAAAVFETASGRFPPALELRYGLGNALRLAGRRPDAERELRAVLAADPRHAGAAMSLAWMFREAGRYRAAAKVALDLWRTRGPEPAESLAIARFLRDGDAFDVALSICRTQLARTPGDPDLLELAGELALRLGRDRAAASCLRTALERDANRPAAWLRWAEAHRTMRAEDADIARCRIAFGNLRLDDMARVAAGFALGRVLDQGGDRTGAADVLREANAGLRARTTWSADAWERFIVAQCGAATPPAVQADPGFVPLFIVGLPRAGTGVLARLLDVHPDIRNRGPLGWTASLAVDLETRGGLHDPAALGDAAHLYAAQLRRDDPPARFFADSNPLNFRHLGLVAALFPNVRVIHCRRDRRDVALSLWSRRRAGEEDDFASNFAYIAAFARGHDRLMEHWRSTLALPLLELDYESLIANPRIELARVARFLGIPAGPLTSAADAAHVDAADAHPAMNAASVGRWRRYADLLPELTAAFPG